MNAHFRSQRGYTLVEIMVVVLIVGILSTLAVTAFIRVKRKTEDVLVLNTIRQYYNAKEEYLSAEGAQVATYSSMLKKGYISASLAAATAHKIGNWNTPALRLKMYRPASPMTISEEIIDNTGQHTVHPAGSSTDGKDTASALVITGSHAIPGRQMRYPND